MRSGDRIPFLHIICKPNRLVYSHRELGCVDIRTSMPLSLYEFFCIPDLVADSMIDFWRSADEDNI